MYRLFSVFFVGCLLLTGKISFAQEGQEFFTVRDLAHDWLVYDYRTSMLVPYLPSVNNNSRVVHFNIDVDLYSDSFIQIKYVPETGFFINNTLIDYSDGRDVRIYSIDSLAGLFRGVPLFISLYSPGFIKNLETRIVTPHKGMVFSSEESIFLPIQQVNYPKVLESAKLAAILIFVLYAFFLNNNRRAFIDYYNISNTFLRVSVDDFLDRTAKITRVDIGFIIGLSVVMAFIALMIIKRSDIQPGMLESGSLTGFMFFWLILMVILFFWYLIRIFIIALMTDLFQIREVKVIHTFELIRLTNFFSLVFFIVVIASLFVVKMAPDILGKMLGTLLLAGALFRMVVLFIKFLNSTTYKKLYLFAYLCVAEVFPVMVGLKILLKSTFFSNVM